LLCMFFFFCEIRRPAISPLFPYTNALPIYDLRQPVHPRAAGPGAVFGRARPLVPEPVRLRDAHPADAGGGQRPPVPGRRAALAGDRKSTRLNSSHVKTSYAVFCLKKKKEST